MCNTVTEMPKVIYIVRKRRLRLLASTLVILAILCNSIAMAQTFSFPAKNDCCPEMSAHQMSSDKVSSNSDNCSAQNTDCNDLCMARCMNANGLLSVQITITPNILIASALPKLGVIKHFFADLDPDLRPPINS